MSSDQRLLCDCTPCIPGGEKTSLRCCGRTRTLLGNIRLERQLACPTPESACLETSPEEPGTLEDNPRDHCRRLQEEAWNCATRTNRRNTALAPRTEPAKNHHKTHQNSHFPSKSDLSLVKIEHERGGGCIR